MKIDFSNAERLVFEDSKLWRLIPDLMDIRNQWALSMKSPHLRPTAKRAILDFLASARPEHENALSIYFGQYVTINNVDTNMVSNLTLDFKPESNIPSEISYDYFCITRNEKSIGITLWR